MSKNPFGQLVVRRDDDEDETNFTNAKPSTTTSTGPLFTQNQADKKKKKVRPEENKKETSEYREENNEGFEEIKKRAPRNKQSNEDETQVDPKARKPKNKGAYLDRNDKPLRDGKRQFDRQSGTGRGKEIAKGGAGGHHTWGNNSKAIAREASKQVETKDYYSRDDDRCNSFLI